MERAQKQSPKPGKFCDTNFGNFGNRRALRGGVEVFLGPIGRTAFISEHPAEVVETAPTYQQLELPPGD